MPCFFSCVLAVRRHCVVIFDITLPILATQSISSIHQDAVRTAIESSSCKLLNGRPPPIATAEQTLSRKTRTTLAQLNAHVSNIARTCYFELRRLASIHRFLTSTATATLVSAFVLSRIDYCSSLLFGSTHDVTSHLQRIQNYAARVILRLPKSSSITIHLKSLHWLPVKVRSTCKIACLCYHYHSSTAPSYITGMLHRKPLHTRNTRSSSYTMPLLNRPAYSNNNGYF